MKYALVILVSLFSVVAFADCLKQVTAQAKIDFKSSSIDQISDTGITLQPGEEKPFWEDEIGNSTTIPLQVYLVETSYMSVHSKDAYLVDSTCKIHNVINVFEE